MSRLAFLLHNIGVECCGSDRCCGLGDTHPMIDRLRSAGIEVYPQNGKHIDKKISKVVVSAAIESDNPELIKTVELKIPVVTRSGLLAELFNKNQGIAVTGTSGKTSTVGMLSTVLRYLIYPHLFYCGDDLCSELYIHSVGKNLRIVAEVDESDGSPVLYKSKHAILTNISLDHKEIDELMEIFRVFCSQCSGVLVVNADCDYTATLVKKLKNKNILTFGTKKSADFFADRIKLTQNGSEFYLNDRHYQLHVAGRHNVYNAMSVATLLTVIGMNTDYIVEGLAEFKGMKRRLELVKEKNGIRVYDDFSHNPDKVFSALSTLKEHCDRLFFIFRPHGYSPMIRFREKFSQAISSALSEQDYIYFMDIYDAGGSANRSIHSKDLIQDLKNRSMNAEYVPKFDLLAEIIKPKLVSGDTVVLMGARDPRLSFWAKQLASELIE